MRIIVAATLLLAAPALAVMPAAEGDPDVVAARQAIDSGRYDLGLDLLQAALARLPGDPDILVYVAFAQRRAGRAEAAMEAYRLALASDANHLAALAYQGSMFVAQGRMAEAEANLARLTMMCPTCAERETLAREIARIR